MPEPTRISVFGANSSETATELVLSKADLAAQGLIPSASNKAEGIFAAIFKLAIPVFGVETYATNLDQSISIQAPTYRVDTRSDNTPVFVRTYTVEIVEPYEDAGINPMAM